MQLVMYIILLMRLIQVVSIMMLVLTQYGLKMVGMLYQVHLILLLLKVVFKKQLITQLKRYLIELKLILLLITMCLHLLNCRLKKQIKLKVKVLVLMIILLLKRINQLPQKLKLISMYYLLLQLVHQVVLRQVVI